VGRTISGVAETVAVMKCHRPRTCINIRPVVLLECSSSTLHLTSSADVKHLPSHVRCLLCRRWWTQIAAKDVRRSGGCGGTCTRVSREVWSGCSV